MLKTEDTWSASSLHRPQSFDDFIGQNTVIDVLKGQLKSGKLSKSYLITGKMGSGKSSLARVIAKKINNTNDDKHSNIRIFKGTVQSGIDDTRALLDSIRYAPMKKGKLVIIAEESHGLGGKAADALLVDLENPPDHVVWILVTNEPHKLKPTILDRCKKLELKPLQSKHIKEMLLRAAKKENVFQSSKYESLFEGLSKIFEGRNRDALNALSNLADISRQRKITKEDINSIVKEVTGVNYSDIPKFLAYMYNNKPREAFAILSKIDDFNSFTFSLLDLNSYLLKTATGLKPSFNYGGNTLLKSIGSIKVPRVNEFQRILIDMRKEVSQVSAVQPEAILLYYATKLGDVE